MQEFTLYRKPNWGWLIERTHGSDLGPYREPTMALRIAAMELVSARKHGAANIAVRDEYGSRHVCRLLEAPQNHCAVCESSWTAAVRTLPPRCPLWEVIRKSSSIAAC